MASTKALFHEIQETRKRFLDLLDSIPESAYPLPTDNPVWTVGDVLFHITLGPHALALEIWMIQHIPRLFEFGLNYLPRDLFNRGNEFLARSGGQITRQGLKKSYEKGHSAILFRLSRMRNQDLQGSISFPPALMSSLAGQVMLERLFQQVKLHFQEHERELLEFGNTTPK